MGSLPHSRGSALANLVQPSNGERRGRGRRPSQISQRSWELRCFAVLLFLPLMAAIWHRPAPQTPAIVVQPPLRRAGMFWKFAGKPAENPGYRRLASGRAVEICNSSAPLSRLDGRAPLTRPATGRATRQPPPHLLCSCRGTSQALSFGSPSRAFMFRSRASRRPEKAPGNPLQPRRGRQSRRGRRLRCPAPPAPFFFLAEISRGPGQRPGSGGAKSKRPAPSPGQARLAAISRRSLGPGSPGDVSTGRDRGPAPQHHLMIFDTTPAPTVRPPSRMAKRSFSSIAIGAISSTSNFRLSPGITISVPSGSFTVPVTSVVRK